MSTLIIAVLAATTLTAVPPSIGSEPAPAGFEYVAAPAQHVASQGPSLAASLGSEPGFLDEAAPRATAPVRHDSRPATLVASVGSEPFVAGAGASDGAPVQQLVERRDDQRVAQNCSCR